MKYYLKLIFRGVQNPQKIYNGLNTLIRNPNTQVFIVSYPKSGRTWLRILIARIIKNDTSDADLQNYIHTYRLTKSHRCKTTQFTHDGPFNLYNYASYKHLSFYKDFYDGREAIFLSRDVRDVLVSHYFEENKRMKTFNGTLSHFIRDDVFGARKIVRFYNIWFTNKKRLKSFIHIRYEDLHRSSADTLRKVVRALDIPEVSDSQINEALEFASFQNLKHLERENAFDSEKLKPTDKNDEESYKVRKGKIGGYRNYLSDKDIAYIERIVEEDGIQECEWYYSD